MLDNQADEQEVKRQELHLEFALTQAADGRDAGDGLIFIKRCYSHVRMVGWLQQKLEAIASTLVKKQTGNYQLQTINELRSSLLSVMPNTEFAVS